MLMLTTFSITALCERTGMVGNAICTAVPAVGALTSFGQAGVGMVSTQAFTNPYLAIDALRLLQDSLTAPQALEAVLEEDPGREHRQVAVIDALGNGAGFTGRECIPWCGHLEGAGFVAAANMMVDGTTTEAMARAFDEHAADPLPERLLKALEAGDATEGDFRGRQSAALLVYHREEYPYLNLRTDEHSHPVAELRRVFEVARRQLVPFLEALPTRANPLGRNDPADPHLSLLRKHVSER